MSSLYIITGPVGVGKSTISKAIANIKLCILVTDEETIVKRDKMRPLEAQMGERSILLLQEFKEMDYSEKYYLDTTLLSVDSTVNEIIKNDKFLI